MLGRAWRTWHKAGAALVPVLGNQEEWKGLSDQLGRCSAVAFVEGGRGWIAAPPSTLLYNSIWKYLRSFDVVWSAWTLELPGLCNKGSFRGWMDEPKEHTSPQPQSATWTNTSTNWAIAGIIVHYSCNIKWQTITPALSNGWLFTHHRKLPKLRYVWHVPGDYKWLQHLKSRTVISTVWQCGISTGTFPMLPGLCLQCTPRPRGFCRPSCSHEAFLLEVAVWQPILGEWRKPNGPPCHFGDWHSYKGNPASVRGNHRWNTNTKANRATYFLSCKTIRTIHTCERHKHQCDRMKRSARRRSIVQNCCEEVPTSEMTRWEEWLSIIALKIYSLKSSGASYVVSQVNAFQIFGKSFDNNPRFWKAFTWIHLVNYLLPRAESKANHASTSFNKINNTQNQSTYMPKSVSRRIGAFQNVHIWIDLLKARDG